MLLSDNIPALSEEHHDEPTKQARIIGISAATLLEGQESRKTKDVGRIHSNHRLSTFSGEAHTKLLDCGKSQSNLLF